MNYQFSTSAFALPLTLLLIVLSVMLNFIGISAFLVYFLFIKFFFPIAISMRIHRLQEQGLALTLTEESQWITYIHGLPAIEKRAALKNPCFFSPERTRQFFYRSFLAKLCLQIACVVILVSETISSQNDGILIISLLVFTGLGYGCVKSAVALYQICQGDMRCDPLETQTGTLWFQCFLPLNDGHTPALSKLL